MNTWGEAEGPQVPRQVDLPSSRLLPTPEGLSVLDFAHRARTRISPSDVSAPSSALNRMAGRGNLAPEAHMHSCAFPCASIMCAHGLATHTTT